MWEHVGHGWRALRFIHRHKDLCKHLGQFLSASPRQARIRADNAWGPCPTYTPHTGGPLHRLLPANRKSATPRRTQCATIEDTMMSANGQHALSDMVELQMYLLAQSQPR